MFYHSSSHETTTATHLASVRSRMTTDRRYRAFLPHIAEGIDVNARSEFYGIMRRLADAGTLVLMISSDMEEILGVSDRIIVMHEGRITATLERGAFDEETIMRHATGIDMQQTTTAA